MEHKREVFFIKKEIIKTSSVFFSSEVINFNRILSEYIERSTTKSPVKSVFEDFQKATSNNSSSLF